MSARRPRLWHPLAPASWGNRQQWRPGYQGTGMQPIRRVPQTAFTRQVTGIQLNGGQAQSKISAGGTATVSIGPTGLGTIWYPAQATISTTSGTADNSTCLIYLGANGVPNLQVGQSYAAGADTVALAVPAMAVGQLLIAVWSGGVHNDLATINILGTMDALTW